MLAASDHARLECRTFVHLKYSEDTLSSLSFSTWGTTTCQDEEGLAVNRHGTYALLHRYTSIPRSLHVPHSAKSKRAKHLQG